MKCAQFSCPIDTNYRSRVNIPFRIGGYSGADEGMENEFLTGAAERHMIQLKGHR
jgi:phosphoserine aminotransferase